MLTALKAFRSVRNTASYCRDEALGRRKQEIYAEPIRVPVYCEYTSPETIKEQEAQARASGTVQRNMTRHALRLTGYDIAFAKIETLGTIMAMLSLLHFNAKHERLSLFIGLGLMFGVIQLRKQRGA